MQLFTIIRIGYFLSHVNFIDDSHNYDDFRYLDTFWWFYASRPFEIVGNFLDIWTEFHESVYDLIHISNIGLCTIYSFWNCKREVAFFNDSLSGRK